MHVSERRASRHAWHASLLFHSEHFRVNVYVLITLDPRNIGEDDLIDIHLAVLDRPLYYSVGGSKSP